MGIRIFVTKEFTFDSAHELTNYEGKCANLHGHTYKLHVTVRRQSFSQDLVDESGMVIDFSKLKEIVQEFVINKLDHRNLNEVLPFQTTAENLSHWIYNTVQSNLTRYDSSLILESVKLWETPTSYAECQRRD